MVDNVKTPDAHKAGGLGVASSNLAAPTKKPLTLSSLDRAEFELRGRLCFFFCIWVQSGFKISARPPDNRRRPNGPGPIRPLAAKRGVRVLGSASISGT